MDGFEDSTHRESTIVNSMRRLSSEARLELSDVTTSYDTTGDRITLSGEAQGNSLCPKEAAQQAWLRTNKGRGLSASANQAICYRPPVLLPTSGSSTSSSYLLHALSAAARRLG